jgi:hypothetical protein
MFEIKSVKSVKKDLKKLPHEVFEEDGLVAINMIGSRESFY